MPTYRTQTFGCKVNQYETREIEELLERAGYAAAPQGQAADLVVVNTCVVTAEAARQGRQAIRRMGRENPGARLIVTGCHVAADARAVAAEAARATATHADSDAPDSADELPGDDPTWIVADQASLLRRLAKELATGSGGASSRAAGGVPTRDGGISRYAGHTRAFVKIQSGCDQFCSYCIIPHVRGHPSSRPSDEVVEEVHRLTAAGHREIVLTGIHLGRYGRDRGDDGALVPLVEQLVRIDGLGRIRLSSIEAGEVGDDLVALMVAHPQRLCPHLHVPLQSGDDGVLRAMRRPYCAAEFLDRVARIREALPGVALTSDVIGGFPGETEAALEATGRVCREAGFSRLHVFPYSPRDGTPAAAMSDQVPVGERRARSAALRGLGQHLAAQFARRLVGRPVTVLVETVGPDAAGRPVAEGFDEHYVRTRLAAPAGGGPSPVRGQLVEARVTSSERATAAARPLA